MNFYLVTHRSIFFFLLWISLANTACTQTLIPDHSSDLMVLLEKTPWDAALIDQAISTKQTAAAKVVLDRRLAGGACEIEVKWMEIAYCAGMARSIRLLDPTDGSGEATLVHWIEAFLSIPDRPTSDDMNRAQGPSAAYTEWSSKKGWAIDYALGREIACSLYIRELAQIGDPKLRQLFRQGIASKSAAIVAASVFGSALIKDKSAIPEILTVIERRKVFPQYEDLFFELAHYDDPEVDRLIRKGAVDKEFTEGLIRELRELPGFKPRPGFMPPK